MSLVSATNDDGGDGDNNISENTNNENCHS